MDTIEWNQDRYETIKEKLSKFLKSIDFLKACTFVPGSGLSGENVFSRCGKEPCLLEVIHQQSSLVRRKQGDLLRLSVTYSTRDCGKIMSFIRVENGKVHTGMDLYDEKGKVTILEIQNQKGSNVTNLSQGENGILFLSSREELPCSFLCSQDCTLTPRTQLLVLLQVLEQTPLFCSGLECVLQLFLNKRECVVEKIIGLQEGDKFTKALFFRKGQVGKVVLKVDYPLLAETFTNYPKLGRFVLRNQSQTIALGKIIGVK
ncbi:Translation elongation factor EF-1 subunit alpha [Brazilian cedratvirus IHUMI]|uniref:Translation elongation factor EF-1 subunit alpha n=1 Tax=Brazilian cedratvirus IHUMI TaxID=2126980 RepID=A0A2R8FFA6_9VIRU|nr:Translation elongation factor EF-1 subunit alpha [Brazilian cedratvirus IHUMI]